MAGREKRSLCPDYPGCHHWKTLSGNTPTDVVDTAEWCSPVLPGVGPGPRLPVSRRGVYIVVVSLQGPTTDTRCKPRFSDAEAEVNCRSGARQDQSL
jgi:hypothetical protein